MKIFNQILHGSLMPWLFDDKEIKTITDNLKLLGNTAPTNHAELLEQIQILLSHKPDLIKWIKTQNKGDNQLLQELYFSTELPGFNDTITKFYSLIIEKETRRIFNEFLFSIKSITDSLIINYKTTITLRTLKRYIIAAAKEIKNRGFKEMDPLRMTLVPFVLYYIKYRLITLYFSIQEVKKDQLDHVIELDDFYLMELNETKADVHLIHREGPEGKNILKKDTLKSNKLSFGFRGDKVKLKSVINQLCIQVELLNEELSPADSLVQLLTSKEITPGKIKIHLDCDNKNFRYIIEKLMTSFESLSFINIEHSQSFFSKRGTLLKANNFSKAKSFDPKLKATIDNIFKEMQ